ncbi:glycosyltransferase, partial [Campylobacter jejuni]|nr:glycosyltransferase [Campylobacter jejuni]HED6045402.1 glycosyltransferase [Campylobacter jejuni]
MALLSVIIPFGLSKERPYIKKRVIEKAKYFKSDENIEFIFVEGFSSQNHNLKHYILKQNHIYLKDQDQKVFSQGKCRNLGASYANAKVILFLDLDCFISFENFEKILKLIQIKNITNNPNALVVLPVVYLTQKANEILKNYEIDFWDALIQEDLISGKKTFVKFFAPSSTSSLIINKHKFLELGGNNESFIGHGYEDFDFFVRVLKSCIKFEKMPFNLNYDSRNWNFYNFKGFRSWFSLLGYEACFYGIYMYHFWHIEPNQNGYMDRKHKNHKLFYKHLKNLKDYHLKPLKIANVKNVKNLALIREKYDFDSLSIYLGDFIYKNIDEIITIKEEDFKNYLNKEKISQILVDVNEYDSLKHFLKDYSCVYFKKGILPDSWLFFDENSDEIYKRKYWNFDLSATQIDETRVYFNSLSLEKKNEIIDFLKKNEIINDNDRYKFIFFLKNELYSFAKFGKFYQIIFNKQKLLTLNNCDKTFYSLQ